MYIDVLQNVHAGNRSSLIHAVGWSTGSVSGLSKVLPFTFGSHDLTRSYCR